MHLFLKKSQRILCISFWLRHIPFINMVKFLSLAQFPVDQISHPVVPCCVILLCYFNAFAYYVINRCISVYIYYFLRIIDFSLNTIGSYVIILCCYKGRFSFSKEFFRCIISMINVIKICSDYLIVFCVAIDFHCFIGIMVRVFANGPGNLGSIPGQVIAKTQKMVLSIIR